MITLKSRGLAHGRAPLLAARARGGGRVSSPGGSSLSAPPACEELGTGPSTCDNHPAKRHHTSGGCVRGGGGNTHPVAPQTAALPAAATDQPPAQAQPGHGSLTHPSGAFGPGSFRPVPVQAAMEAGRL